MQSFKDLKGRQWDLSMKLRHARLIESRLGINILSPESSEESALSLITHPMKMVEMLWILCESQAKENGITLDDFEDALDGQSYLAAEKKMQEELLFFIQSIAPHLAKLWTVTLRKAAKVSSLMVTKMEAFLDSTELDEMVETEMTRVINEGITTLRETHGKQSGN